MYYFSLWQKSIYFRFFFTFFYAYSKKTSPKCKGFILGFGRIPRLLKAGAGPGYSLQFLANRFCGLLWDFRYYPLRTQGLRGFASQIPRPVAMTKGSATVAGGGYDRGAGKL
jgi:hypothetical protein